MKSSRHTDHLSTRITVQTAAQRELTRADVFTRRWGGHANTVLWDQVLEFGDEHKWLLIQTSLKPNRRNTVQRESQKAFQFTHRHLPCIYCSDIHWHHGYVTEIWDIHTKFYYRNNSI